MNRRALLAAGAVLPFAGAVRAEAPSSGRLVTHAGFGATHVQARNVSVWLPPGYDASDARHPVLYMHDGQNLFDKPSTAPAEWDADEAATDLIAKGEMQLIIIVGIPHAGDSRIREYMPVAALDR